MENPIDLNVHIGMSFERSPGSMPKWKEFFSRLGVELIISDIRPELAAKKAEKIFHYCTDYCFFRKSCLGQYIDLIERGCKYLLIPVRVKDGHLVCNSTSFMAREISEYYPNTTVLSIKMYTSGKKLHEVEKVARYFSNSDERINLAIEGWKGAEKTRKNVFIDSNVNEKNISLMLVGKINHFFDYTSINSPMIRFLVNKLNVGVIDPENINNRTLKDVKQAHTILHKAKFPFTENRDSYWPETYILASILASKRNNISGVILVRDAYCNAGIEEINILNKIISTLNIPTLIVNYNLEAQSSIETLLETFVQMIEWKQKGWIYK